MCEDVVRSQALSAQIMADAVHALLTRPADGQTGRSLTDAQVRAPRLDPWTTGGRNPATGWSEVGCAALWMDSELCTTGH